MLRPASALALAASAVLSSASFGATVTWNNGANDGNWNTPANWTWSVGGPGIPGTTDDVVLPSAAPGNVPAAISLGGNQSVSTVTFNRATTLNDNTLTLNSTSTTGIVRTGGGAYTITVNSGVSRAIGVSSSGGHLFRVDDGFSGSLIVNGAISFGTTTGGNETNILNTSGAANAGHAVTLAGDITGTTFNGGHGILRYSLSKGNLTISGDNTYTLQGTVGTTQLNSVVNDVHTVFIGSNNPFSSRPVQALGNTTLATTAHNFINTARAVRLLHNTSGLSLSNKLELFNSTTSTVGLASTVLSGNSTWTGGIDIPHANDGQTASAVTFQSGGADTKVTFSGTIASPGATGRTVVRPVTIAGSGAVEFTSANSYGGATTVTSGATLLANNTTGSATGSGSVMVNASGKIGGGGFIDGAATINGKIIPAAGVVGTLSFRDNVALNGQYDADVNAAAADLIALIGGTNNTLTFGGASALDILGTLNSSVTYILATFGSRSGEFFTVEYNGSLQSTPTSTGGVNGTHTLVYGGTSVQLVPVPEPTALSLLVAGVGLLAPRRRVLRS